jgi:hypothetical protein
MAVRERAGELEMAMRERKGCSRESVGDAGVETSSRETARDCPRR